MSASVDTTDVVDAATLEKVIAKATPEQRRHLVDKLLTKTVEDGGYILRAVRNKSGELVAVLLPDFRSRRLEPPVLTDAEYAEIDRRIAATHEHITHEQLLADLGLADKLASRRK
jgi:hypothetical protein